MFFALSREGESEGIPYIEAQGKAWRDVLLICKCGYTDSILVWDDTSADGSADDINYFAKVSEMKQTNADHIPHGCMIGLGKV